MKLAQLVVVLVVYGLGCCLADAFFQDGGTKSAYQQEAEQAEAQLGQEQRENTTPQVAAATLSLESEAQAVESLKALIRLLELERHFDMEYEGFLRDKGWTLTHDAPGSLPLWGKEIDGVQYRVEKDTALVIQHAIDNQTVSNIQGPPDEAVDAIRRSGLYNSMYDKRHLVLLKGL